VPNLKSVALIVFELLAFDAQKFRGSRDHATPPFGKIFGSHVRTVPGKTCVKFEVRSFNRFEQLAFNSHDRPLRTHKHTNRQTDTHRTNATDYYLRHSLRSLGGDNNQLPLKFAIFVRCQSLH